MRQSRSASFRSGSESRFELLKKINVFLARGRRRHSRIFVRSLPLLPSVAPRAVLRVGSLSMPCVVGRSGIGVKRMEGDAITPAGNYKIIQWRAQFDRLSGSHVGCRQILKNSGWCDDPRSPAYNHPVRLPYPFSAEAMWRDDQLYDLIGVINFNFRPRVRGRGSAIFLHIAHDDFSPTAGCIALPRARLRKLKSILSAQPQIFIGERCWRRSPKTADPTRIRVAPT